MEVYLIVLGAVAVVIALLSTIYSNLFNWNKSIIDSPFNDRYHDGYVDGYEEGKLVAVCEELTVADAIKSALDNHDYELAGILIDLLNEDENGTES